MAARILIFSNAMGAEYSSYVKTIETHVRMTYFFYYSKVVYIKSSFRLLAPESRDLSQAEKETIVG